jgi:hypothetical protein
MISQTWAAKPENYRLQCVSNHTIMTVLKCIGNLQKDSYAWHVGEDQVEAERLNPWLYMQDGRGNQIQPAPGPIH